MYNFRPLFFVLFFAVMIAAAANREIIPADEPAVVTKEEEEFNTIIPKLPRSEGDDDWTYQLFCGLLRDEMEDLLKPLSLQKRSQYRILYNSAETRRWNHINQGTYYRTLF